MGSAQGRPPQLHLYLRGGPTMRPPTQGPWCWGVLPPGSVVPSPCALSASSTVRHSHPRCHPPAWAEAGSPPPQFPQMALTLRPKPALHPTHLPAPSHDVFLEQHLGLEAAVAAFGLFCQVVEPGMLQALASTHPGAGGERSPGHPCLSPSPPTTPFSSRSRAPKPQKTAGEEPTGGMCPGTSEAGQDLKWSSISWLGQVTLEGCRALLGTASSQGRAPQGSFGTEHQGILLVLVQRADRGTQELDTQLWRCPSQDPYGCCWPRTSSP